MTSRRWAGTVLCVMEAAEQQQQQQRDPRKLTRDHLAGGLSGAAQECAASFRDTKRGCNVKRIETGGGPL